MIPTLETWGVNKRARIVMEIPMHGFLAQLVVPRDMKAEEAERLCALIKTLVIPETK